MGYLTKETCRGSSGWTYKQWVVRETKVPRVPDNLLNCAIYLYESESDASAGTRSGGSGFLIGVPFGTPEPLGQPFEMTKKYVPDVIPDTEPHVYAVTNGHVLDKGNRTIRLNTRDGKTEILDVPESRWRRHLTSDIAITPLPLDPRLHLFNSVNLRDFLSPRTMKELDVGIGDDVVAIGRFVNVERDKKEVQRNEPVARFGHIAGFPGVPLKVKHSAGRVRNEESILVEMRTIPGYSGSPVFLRIPPWELLASSGTAGMRKGLATPKGEDESAQAILRLLGIAWGFIYDHNLAVTANGKELKSFKVQAVNSGMMGVVPAWKLLDILNRDDLREIRKQEVADQQSGGSDGQGC